MKPFQAVLFILLPSALIGFLIGGWIIIHNGLDGNKSNNIPLALWISIFCCWIMMFGGLCSILRKKKK
jgi:hypothetical protein